jgi:hypothetical protein
MNSDSHHSSRERLAALLALGLVTASAVAYFLLWSALKYGGCGPPGHSTEGRILVFAPFALPAIATVVILGIAAKLKWRPGTVLVTVLLTILATGALEVLVFLLEFAAGNCGE